MLLSTIVIAVLGPSTTIATPLVGSLWGSRNNIQSNDGSFPHLNERGMNEAELPTCRRDNLWRIFHDVSDGEAASEFCSLYIASSSLVRARVTPTYTTTLNVTATGAFTTVTIDVNATASSEPCSTSNATVLPYMGSSPNATASVVSPPLKRQAPPVPPTQAATFAPLRLSSICSCLVTPSTIVTTLIETAPPEYTTEMYTIQAATAEIPEDQNPPASTANSISQTSNDTAAATATISIPSNETEGIPATVSTSLNTTADATATLSQDFNNTAVSSATITIAPNNTANATATLSQSLNNTALSTTTISIGTNGTVNATATIPSNQTTTTPTGLPGPSGTNVTSSAVAAYCNDEFARGNGSFLARYTVRCGYSYSNLNPVRVESRASYATCLRECDIDSRCYAFSFLLAAVGGGVSNCFIYNYYPLPAGQEDAAFDSGSYVVGSNNGLKR